MKRIIIFLLTNFAVILTLGIIFYITGVKNSNTILLLIISSLIGFGGALISLMMSKSIALWSVKGKIISKTNNNKENWLLNMVCQQAKKVNIATPQVAIYPALHINAFATGAHRNNALIAVTTGLLDNMTYDEAEAVLAHEISHIVNGDMVTMTLIQGIMNTFVIFVSRIIAQCIANIFISQDKNDNNITNAESIYFFISIILEITLGILASIIIFWFSRYREFHADAGSAKLVGKRKMIEALQKLKNSYETQESNNIISLCINGNNNVTFSELFMSHPPLEKRIEALRIGLYLK